LLTGGGPVRGVLSTVFITSMGFLEWGHPNWVRTLYLLRKVKKRKGYERGVVFYERFFLKRQEGEDVPWRKRELKRRKGGCFSSAPQTKTTFR